MHVSGCLPAAIYFIVDSGACMLMIIMPQAGHSTDIRASPRMALSASNVVSWSAIFTSCVIHTT